MVVGIQTVGPRILICLWLAISALAQTTTTQSYAMSFAYPPAESTGQPRLTINVLDTVDVEWTSNYGQTWLYLWCDEYDDDGKMITIQWFMKEVFATGDLSYRPWDALESDTTDRTGKYPFACHFDLLFSDKQHGILGPNLNITSRAGETIATTFARRTTQVGTAATTTPTGLSSGVSSTSQTASSTSSPSAASSLSNGSGGLSTGAKAGIAIGAVIAALAFAAVSYLFYRNHRKLKELESRTFVQDLTVEPKTAASDCYRQDYQLVAASELDNDCTYELPAQPAQPPEMAATTITRL